MEDLLIYIRNTILILMLLGSPLTIICTFLLYMVNNGRFTNTIVFKIVEIWTAIVLPIYFIFTIQTTNNSCCGGFTEFSAENILSIQVFVSLFGSLYLYTMYKKTIAPPIIELIINSILISGIILNCFLFIHISPQETGTIAGLIGHFPIILLILMKLYQRHEMMGNHLQQNQMNFNTQFGLYAYQILRLNPFIKYPILTIILAPIIICFSLTLLIFGQQPDSIIKAFTQTYKHGFSELTMDCSNVECGGHFLCSVGANGHKKIVNPIRYGQRHGARIICTRQLLICNAFEELIQERFPALHRVIRKQYNKVGDKVHQYYDIFNIKWISDVIYLLMKPLEWLFLITLYFFDHKPEDRIHKQYLSKTERRKIDHLIKKMSYQENIIF